MSGDQPPLTGLKFPGRRPGVTYIITTGRSVAESPRQGSSGPGAVYSMSVCPVCGAHGPQLRGKRYRDGGGVWVEERTCKVPGCKGRERAYTVPLLPYEVASTERFA